MRTISKALLFIPLALLAFPTYGLTLKNDSLRFELLLTRELLYKNHITEKLTGSIDITPNRLILLATKNQFYLLGWGGIKQIGKEVVDKNLNSFAYTHDNVLMVIRANELCVLDSLGTLSKLFKLPNEGMRICAGRYVMYLYDCNKNQAKNALYVIAKGGKYAKLFEVPKPIMSVVEMNDSIIFATENGLFSFNMKSKELKAIAVLPKNTEVKSIAIDTSAHILYFSTDKAIYALKDSSAIILTNKLGGILRCFNKGLIVFNPENNSLIRIAGIEAYLQSTK
jgi:hypothetical protein